MRSSIAGPCAGSPAPARSLVQLLPRRGRRPAMLAARARGRPRPARARGRGHQHARAPGPAADQRLEQLGASPGRGWRAARRAAAAAGRAGSRAAARRWTMPFESSRTGSSARAFIPTAPSSSSTRGSGAMQAGRGSAVLARGELAVEERLVAQVAHPTWELPALAWGSSAPSTRALPAWGAAGRRVRAAASSCRRRCRRARRAWRPPGRSRSPPRRHPLAEAALEALELDRRRHSPTARSSVAAACFSVGSTIGHDCSIALGLPGKFTIRVRPGMPDTPA